MRHNHPLDTRFMNQDPILISAPWIAPVVPREEVLQDHSLLVSNGKIAEILPTPVAIEKYPGLGHTILNEHILIPGLVNTHTHAAMTLFRGMADDLPLDQWLNDHIWPAEAKWVNESFIKDGTELAVAEMLMSGTTCFNDMYFYPEVVARCAQSLGIRCIVSMIVLDFPSVWASSTDEYFEKGLEVHDEVRSLSLVGTALAPHAPYTVGDQSLERVRTLADELDVQIHMHVHETKQEVENAVSESGKRPLERLAGLGLLNPKLIAVHMTQLTDEEIELCAKHGVNVAHCPESNLKLASGFCPTGKLQAAGINVSIGTDGAASNNDLDLLGELRTASLIAKPIFDSATTLSAHSALEMATINGARSLNLEEQIGSLEIGKRADIAAIDLNYVSTQPVFDPVSQLVYSASRNQVTNVWVDGVQRVRNKELVFGDVTEVMQKAKSWKKKIEEE